MQKEIVAAIIGSGTTILGIYLKHWLEGRKSVSPNTDIKGQWNIFVEGSSHTDRNAIMDISQHGDKIEATCRYLRHKDGTSYDATFKNEGRFSSGLLTLYFFQKNSPDITQGAIVFRLLNSDEFVGRSVFWSNTKKEFDFDDFKMVRTK